MRALVISISVMMLIGCEPEPANPEDVYLMYLARSVEGMSFDEELGFWSEGKIAQLDERLTSLMERSGRTREEAVELYMEISKRTAKCTELELLSKEIVEATADIVFASTDTCGGTDDALHNIRLVLEKEWKLDEVEIVF